MPPPDPPDTRTLQLGKRGARPSRSWLVIVLESQRPLAGGRRHTLEGVEQIRLGRGSTPDARGRVLEVRVADPAMSQEHARIARLGGRWVIEDLGSKNGIFVGERRVQREPLEPGVVVRLGGSFVTLLESDAEPRHPGAPAHDALASWHPELEAAFDRLESVAGSPVPVLVHGETGTGKELAARAIHELSGRAGELVAVNCGALPENLVVSTLFGHRRGAFSGATHDQDGLARRADRGTLFLDEVGELAEPAQVALLRLLQEGEVAPVGAARPQKVDVRVVAATHRSLEAGGRLRADLLGRLDGYRVELPPLRQRPADLGLLLARLLTRLAGPRAASVRLEAEAAAALVAHDWPLNVRELEQALAAALALAGDGPIAAEHLPESVRSGPPAGGESGDEAQLQERLERLMREHEGNVSAVARAMGKDRTQIRRWLRRFGIGAASD